MPLASAWDLVSTESVPNTVELWPLRNPPRSPQFLGTLELLHIHAVSCNATWSPPNVLTPGQFAWREFEMVLKGPPFAGEYPFMVYAVAIVEKDFDAPALLAWFRFPGGIKLGLVTERVIINGWCQACRFQG